MVDTRRSAWSESLQPYRRPVTSGDFDVPERAVTAWGRMAEVGKNLGVDVWKYRASNGVTLRKVVDQLIPGALHGTQAWPHQQIGVFDRSIAADIFHAAAEEAQDTDAAAALRQMPLPAGGDTWPVRVSCFPLDPPLR